MNFSAIGTEPVYACVDNRGEIVSQAASARLAVEDYLEHPETEPDDDIHIVITAPRESDA